MKNEQTLSKDFINHSFESSILIEFYRFACFDGLIEGVPDFRLLSNGFSKAA